MIRRTVPAVACVLAIVGSPAFAQNREHQQMAAELRMLQEQTQQLAITLNALNQVLAESLKQLNARIDENSNSMRRGFADQKLLIDNMAGDVSRVRERAGDTNVRIGSLQEELEALRATVQAFQQTAVAPAVPLGTTPPTDPAATTTTPPPPAALPPPPPASSTAGLSPTRLYETAQADYFAGQWSSAISGFEAFLRAFPRSEQADDAQLYIGETYFAQNQWNEAIGAYNQLIQAYPGTNSVPVAYYKRGLAEERLGQIDAARVSWEAAATSFPDSDAGRLAKQNLDRLSRAQPR
jgi:tol-pal system protein YbgF